MTYIPPTILPKTAFGDLRIAEISPQVQVTFEYNINPNLLNTVTSNGGIVKQEEAMAVLETSTNSTGLADIKTIRLLKYRSGLGALTRFTGLFTTGVANSTQLIGVGTDENGFFFGFNGITFGILHRVNSIDTWINQSSWNVDTMDGNGPSSMILDINKINVFEISYQYLGAGQITFFIEDSNTGEFVIVHKIKYTNINIIPSLFNPSLPLNMHVENNGNTSNIIIKSASMAAFVEGKDIIIGAPYTFNNSKTHSSETALFSIRNKSTFAGKTNLVNAFMRNISCANDVNQLATFKIYEDATLGGTPSFLDIEVNSSIMESDTSGTTVSGGKLLVAYTIGKDSGQTFELDKLNIIMKPGSTYTITSDSASSNVMGASLSWVEDF